MGEQLRPPALHAFMIPCGTKPAQIAPPNTLTDAYIRFLSKAQPYLSFVTRTPKSKPFFYITDVYRLNTLVGSLRFLITLLKYTLFYYINELNTNKITLLSYNQI